MDDAAKLEANRKMLQRVDGHLHMLRQGILPPDIASQALLTFKSQEAAVAGMLRAREADKANLEHIIEEYRKGQA